MSRAPPTAPRKAKKRRRKVYSEASLKRTPQPVIDVDSLISSSVATLIEDNTAEAVQETLAQDMLEMLRDNQHLIAVDAWMYEHEDTTPLHYVNY
mmetsp:Transcript_10280/g.11355  ORF Transcript_10280/g.11355 Transcript_10280/m.11355 type:complete len:95 (+) Transcript_10280:36-320(+)